MLRLRQIKHFTYNTKKLTDEDEDNLYTCSILSLDRVLDFDSPTLTSYFTLSVRGQVVV